YFALSCFPTRRSSDLMKEFIDISISLTYKDTITFLIEKNQILSFVFLDPEKDLLAVLENIKSTIEQDRQFGFATIAISSPYEHRSEEHTSELQSRENL